MVQATKDEEVLREVVVAFRDVVVAARRKAGSPDPVERGSLSLLSYLADLGAMRGTELAQLACLDASTVSRHLRALEAAGHIRRRPDPDDGRAHVLELSEEGRDALTSSFAQKVDLFSRVTADWSRQDITTLATLLRRLASDLENE